jgi:hypothetical protein
MPNVIELRQSHRTPEEVHESMTRSEEQEEQLSPEARLLLRLAKWLVAQPEYPLVFLNDRQTRRQFSKEAAKVIFTIPQLRI